MKKIINILSILGIVVAPAVIGLLYSFETRTSQLKAEAMQEIVAKDFPLNQPRFIDFQVDEESLEGLTERQQNNQLRDWLLFTIAFSHGLSPNEINQNFERLPTFRYDHGQPLSELQYGDTRSLDIGQGQVVALLPKQISPQERIGNLAQIIDQHRQDLGEIPTSLVVFEYEINPDQQFATITRRQVLNPKTFFSNINYGYYEATINSREDLTHFINQVDYLTFAQIKDSSLRLGGRKIDSYQYPKITLEDVATIWQSERKIQEPGSSFSLEPSYDYRRLENALAEAEPSLRSLTSGIAPAITQQDIQQAKNGLAQNNEISYLVLANKLANSNNPTVAEQGKTALARAMSSRFQVAHYSEKLQGTEVGMLLFYTDLLAKLWAIDYLSNTPERDSIDFQPPKLVTAASTNPSQIKSPSTIRIGLGARDNSFQVIKENNSLFLEPNATQIYAAAYNSLQPSAAKTVSADADAFLHWWSDRYEEVLVPNEPQYERLDELIKWGYLISWLNETNQGEVLNFLNTVPVKRNHWFPDWVQTNSDRLNFSILEQVNFYQQGYKDSTTEAMPILASKPSQYKGESKFISGEVLLAKRGGGGSFGGRSGGRSGGSSGGGYKSRPTSPDFSQPRLEPDGTLPDQEPSKTSPDLSLPETSPDIPPPKTSSRAQEKVKFHSFDSGISTPEFTNNTVSTVSGFRTQTNVDGTHLGNFNVARTRNGFIIGWQSRNILLEESSVQENTPDHTQEKSAELADDLQNYRYDEILQKLDKEPSTLKRHYNTKLTQIRKLLLAKDYTKALQEIDASIDLYGQRPDLMLFKGVVEIERGRINVERVMHGQPSFSKEQSRKIFFDQVKEFLPNYKFKVKFHRSKTDQSFFYVQDTPGLNNIDWQLGIEHSLPLISAKARVYKLLPGEIGDVSLSMIGFENTPPLSQSQDPNTLNPDGNPDDECNNSQENQDECNHSYDTGDNPKSVYIVIETK